MDESGYALAAGAAIGALLVALLTFFIGCAISQ
jgi:hypothetical protein